MYVSTGKYSNLSILKGISFHENQTCLKDSFDIENIHRVSHNKLCSFVFVNIMQMLNVLNIKISWNIFIQDFFVVRKLIFNKND